MLVCCEDDSLTDDEDISPKKESKRFIWNHGSMSNVCVNDTDTVVCFVDVHV